MTARPAATGPPEFGAAPRPGDLSGALRPLLDGGTLGRAGATAAFEAIMTGSAHHAEVGALLALLATRTPTVDELVGAAAAMRRHVDGVPTRIAPDRLLDTAGTGGAPKTFNVSTVAAIVAAAAGRARGIGVAKHGNRSRTGRGSAEVLAALGVNVDADRAIQARALDECGVCFCFAVHHHPAARHAMPVRKALGFPTIFNLLGPLTNPVGARRQLMGVYERRFVRPIAEALAQLGAVHAMVVHSDDGLDELSIGAPTHVAEAVDGAVREYDIDPQALGLRPSTPAALAARDLDHAAALARDVLEGVDRGAHRDMTALNAGAALRAAGVVDSIAEGVALALETIDRGDARRTLAALIRVTAEASPR